MCFRVCEKITARPGRKFGYKVVHRRSHDVSGNQFQSVHRYARTKGGTPVPTLYSLGVESRINVRKGTKQTRKKRRDWRGKEVYDSTRGFYIYPSLQHARADCCRGRTIIKVAVKPKDFLYEGVRRRVSNDSPQATYRAITPVAVVS